jgi:uncharacterized protein YoxC
MSVQITVGSQHHQHALEGDGTVSGWDVAGIIIAVFWAILVCFLAYVLIHVARVLQETTVLISEVTEQTVPLLAEVRTTVTHTNTELTRVDAITSSVQNVAENASSLSSLFAATLGTPLVKAAALSYGLRRAMKDRTRHDVEKRVRAEVRAERAARRSGRG